MPILKTTLKCVLAMGVAASVSLAEINIAQAAPLSGASVAADAVKTSLPDPFSEVRAGGGRVARAGGGRGYRGGYRGGGRRGYGGLGAAGLIGGLALGAIAAGAAQQQYYGGDCYIQRRRVWDGYGWVIQRYRVCE